MVKYYMSKKVEIIEASKFKNWHKIIIYTYCMASIASLLICCAIGDIKAIAISSIPCFISPIINEILKYIFNNMQIIYKLNKIINVTNPSQEAQLTIDITDLNEQNIMKISNSIEQQRTYIYIEYNFESSKYIFTNISKILRKQEIKQKIYYNPRKFTVKIYKNSKIIYKSDISKYKHLLNNENGYAISVESVIIPAINDALEFAINSKELNI